MAGGNGGTLADAVLRCDSATAAELAGGRMTLADAINAGPIHAEGQPESLAELLELLSSQLLLLSSQV